MRAGARRKTRSAQVRLPMHLQNAASHCVQLTVGVFLTSAVTAEPNFTLPDPRTAIPQAFHALSPDQRGHIAAYACKVRSTPSLSSGLSAGTELAFRPWTNMT